MSTLEQTGAGRAGLHDCMTLDNRTALENQKQARLIAQHFEYKTNWALLTAIYAILPLHFGYGSHNLTRRTSLYKNRS